MKCIVLNLARSACRRLKSVLGPAVLLTLLFLLWTAPAFSQACAMCYSTAAATSKDGQRAITRGVIVLVAPPLGVMTLGVGLAFRYGRKRDEEQNRDQVQ
jgi:hypothetical protein